ncbi:MAG: hypothetical protein ABWW65_00875 [Thermoprotei archaeon]
MEIKPVVSKTAHLLAELYDLYHAFSEEKSPVYLFYHGEQSRLLYYGYYLEKHGLWEEAFKAVIGLPHDNRVDKVLEELSTIPVYNWDEIEDLLEKHGNELVKVYTSKREEIAKLLDRILGIRKFYDRVYVVLAFNPLNKLVGSLPVHREDGEYAVASLFIGIESTPEKSLDLLLHELLHGLIRLNELDIPEEEEEEFIGILCPEGFLSRELGLVTEVNVEESGLTAIVERYFNEKRYRELTLLEYIRAFKNTQYLQ